MSDWTPESILAELRPIFEDVLEEPGIVLTPRSNSWNTPNWDSLAHIELIEITERRFQVRFELAELQGLKEVGDLVNLIITKINQN